MSVKEHIPKDHKCQHCGHLASPAEWIDVLPKKGDMLGMKLGRGVMHVCSRCNKETQLVRSLEPRD